MIFLNKGINLIKGLVGSSYLLEIDQLLNKYKTIVVILDNNHQVDALYNELKSVYKTKIILTFPDYGLGPYDNGLIDKNIIRDRYRYLIDQTFNKSSKIIITTFKSVFYKIPNLKDISSSWKEISKMTNYNELLSNLLLYRYQKTSKVEEPGQYRISGSIIDFFSIISDKPVRINFFEDYIETIKEYDPITQLSIREIDKINICSNGIFNISDENISNYKKEIKEYFDEEYIDDIEYERVTTDKDNSHIHNLIPKLFKNTKSMLSLIKGEFACYAQKNPSTELHENLENLNNMYENYSLDKYILKPNELLVSDDEVNKIIENNYFYISSDHIDAQVKINAGYTPLPSLLINYNYKNPFINFENFFNNSKYNYIFFVKREDNFKTLTNYFSSKGIKYHGCDEINLKNHRIQIIRSDINEGFIDNNTKVVYVSSNDIFGLVKTRLSSNEIIKASVIQTLSDLKINDLVVHQNHGIGRYKGLITMDIENKVTELIKLEYAENNNLYMPITSMSLIQKYIGGSGLSTRLSRLGSDKWLKIKLRAKRKIEDIAAELLSTQAKRELDSGFKFDFKSHDYNKFCNLFQYVETNDQLQSMNDVINDMCSLRSMDRVICGDVGFGKTEIILRASFIAVNNKKQVVIIVPTTVLAKQHYDTFKNRFANYEYDIQIVTRAVSHKDKVNVINRVNNNETHIVIGTHALLSKDFKYANLGLLIIDEEHKFGVKHKESIKSIKESVDVLTLSATPIPRTLNSALSEIKDMSIISTPPIGRKNIETCIIEKTSKNIKDFIERELTRGGQLLYIHNNIDTMNQEIAFLKGINPYYKIDKIHGRLSNKEINILMKDFLNEKISILVCTSIIESGLDMTNVNTIIINDAQNFGLSQLHQLRGRVGRSNKQAYAGLIICEKNKLTQDADKRINAFISTNSLAGGIDIAGHDLEIRGAGEILGEEQSGQIFEIGYGMYTTMLSKAIQQIRNKKEIEVEHHVEMDSYISTLIPQDYVEDIFLRLEIYNDISNAKNDYDINHIITKLEDIYGPIPDYLNNLLDLTKVRIIANRIKAERIKINREYSSITLNSKSIIDNDKFIRQLSLNNQLKLAGKNNLRYRNDSDVNFSKLCEGLISVINEIST